MNRLRVFVRRLRYQRNGWKVDQWGNRYYDGPRMANDGTLAVDGDGWPE